LKIFNPILSDHASLVGCAKIETFNPIASGHAAIIVE